MVSARLCLLAALAAVVVLGALAGGTTFSVGGLVGEVCKRPTSGADDKCASRPSVKVWMGLNVAAFVLSMLCVPALVWAIAKASPPPLEITDFA